MAASAKNAVELSAKVFVAPVVIGEPGEEPDGKDSLEFVPVDIQVGKQKMKTAITTIFLQRLQGADKCLQIWVSN